MGNFVETIHFCKYSLEMYRLFDDKKGTISAIKQIGKIYRKMGNSIPPQCKIEF